MGVPFSEKFAADFKADVEAVLEWAKENDWFDARFVQNVYEDFKRDGWVTEKQWGAIKNIIRKCGIE